MQAIDGSPSQTQDKPYHLSAEEQSSVLSIQHSVLEMVARDCSDEEVMTQLCRLAEKLLPNSVASIMTRQPEGHLDVLCAPSVPDEGVSKLNGLIPSNRGGSCGNAVYQNKPMFVVDAATDPRCDDIRDVLEEFGLCACWSYPIRDPESQAIGSFALSSFEIREPDDFHKQLLGICACMTGIVLERCQQREQLEFLAYNDQLTGMANRVSLYEKINSAIETSHKEGSSFALLFLDLDRFKNLNDTFGHSVGDDVLVLIAKRLHEEYLLEGDVLARVGGDEFVFLVQNVESVKAVKSQAETLLKKIKEPIDYNTHRFLVDGSVGISLYPNHGETAEQLIKHADIAMYHAKKFCASRVSVYESSLSDKVELAFNIEHELYHALENNEFELFFQTQVDANSNQVCGIEALIRWAPPGKGVISPADFIPIAEENGLIVPVGQWVLEEALRQVEPIVESLPQPTLISINLSGVQLANGDLDSLLSIINASSISNHCIELEITESVMVQNAISIEGRLGGLQESGVRLAIDDFGTGYSSLAYLKRFNVDTLKIDRMLTQDITVDQDALSIVKAAIVMAKSLGLRVVVEGVETQEQADILKQAGCDCFQGFYFCKPAPLKELQSQGII